MTIRAIFVATVLSMICCFGSVSAAESWMPSQSKIQQSDMTPSVVRELFLQYTVLRIIADETGATPRMHAALEDHGTAISDALGLLNPRTDAKAIDTLIFASSFAIDGALGEDLVCSVLSKRARIKPALTRALRTTATPCELAAQTMLDKPYVDQQTFVSKLCKSPRQFFAWIRDAIGRIDHGDRCEDVNRK